MSNFSRVTFFTLSILILSSISGAVYAQWSSDPAVNLSICDGSGDQVVPHIAIASDNYCYTGWYDNRSGNYDVGLQLLDPDGVEQWAHNGIIVSSHPQDSWVMDWALIADSAGNAIVAFVDIRGGNSNVHAYKIDRDGNFLWGVDGISITNNADFKGPPSLVETNDGDIVVAWYTDGSAAIKVQRLNAAGALQYEPSGVTVSEVADTMPSGQFMVPSGADGFILGYVPIYSFMANRQIKAQLFNAAAQPVWTNYLMIMDDSTVPMGHYFEMMSDGNDGAFFSWSILSGMGFAVRAQHVNAAGVESYVHNGKLVSTEPSFAQIAPGMTHDPVTGQLTVLYIQQTGDQNQKGVFGQRISPAGELLWGAYGQQILPVNTSNEGFVRAVDTGDGVIGLCFQAPQSAYGQDEVIGFKLDTNGAFVWEPSIVGVSTLLSSKDDLLAVIGTDNTARAIWVDQRNGTSDVFGQNLNDDGSLGLDLSGVSDIPVSIQLNQNYPNPFNPATNIVFSLPTRQHTLLEIYDTRGRVVRTLMNADIGPGSQTVRWDGQTNSGLTAPTGVYYVRMTVQTAVGQQQRTLPITLVK
ncbi:MAG: T9SS type A sorting domain-containing protein [bacterium]|nr:T9SS type A sorting domain-containing protein [bacterium]MCP4801083.1 T9SS type A sorting domain-containing protein [bacterium]